ncbi:MAG TPA: ribose-5-phosphate isomerase RpiA [Cytophagaceae bacterium]|nr:ribose-5-phosphate isomerase RpiA [Cytophagaceae bacterium]
MNQETEKQIAAYESVKLVEDGMIVGLGSGSTSAYMIKRLGERVSEGLKIKGVASSEKTKALALSVGIEIISLDEAPCIDINIDGADEFDSYLQLIKGGGGALLREKIIASNAAKNIIIADSSKEVHRLGKFRLPIETIPFATGKIISVLEKKGLDPKLRKTGNEIFSTDENNYILDLNIAHFTNLAKLQEMLITLPGVVETGLFLDTTYEIIVGKETAVLYITK